MTPLAAHIQRFDNLFNTTPSADVRLGDALDAITHGTYAAAIEQVRHVFTTHGEDAYKKAKERLPQWTFAGTFAPTRAKEHLVRASGICHADIDHLTDLDATKHRVMADPCVIYCFTSPRGDGLKYGVRIASVDSDEAYKHAWAALAATHQSAYGVTWDRSGKDVCRLCFVSWDPDCYVNLHAEIYDISPPPAAQAPAAAVSTLQFWYAPVSGDRRARYARQALDRATQMIDQSVPGQQHYARCQAVYLLGGYTGGNLLTYTEAYAALEAAVRRTAQDVPKAMKDIVDCLTAGQAKPITVEELEADWQRWKEAHPLPSCVWQRHARPKPSVFTRPTAQGGSPWH